MTEESPSLNTFLMSFMEQLYDMGAAASGYREKLKSLGFSDHMAEAIAGQWLVTMQERLTKIS